MVRSTLSVKAALTLPMSSNMCGSASLGSCAWRREFSSQRGTCLVRLQNELDRRAVAAIRAQLAKESAQLFDPKLVVVKDERTLEWLLDDVAEVAARGMAAFLVGAAIPLPRCKCGSLMHLRTYQREGGKDGYKFRLWRCADCGVCFVDKDPASNPSPSPITTTAQADGAVR